MWEKVGRWKRDAHMTVMIIQFNELKRKCKKEKEIKKIAQRDNISD